VQYSMVPPGGHQLPPLPYPYNALEPVISATTLCFHHDKHHQSYVEGLNNAELKLVEARHKRDFSLIKHWERELAFHGSGHILHSIYWTGMAPFCSGGQPGDCTQKLVESYFGSIPLLQEQFTAAATKVEASGWVILVWQPAWNRLELLTAEKHQNLTQWGSIPLLILDLWEHAYYLDYQNRRADYVKSWWNIVNWTELERRLALAFQGRLPLIS
jgi:Fe-Mn family superoxide dismutase